MLLSSIVDFYITEAVTAFHPEFGNKAQEKLYDDAVEYFATLSHDMALCFRDYLVMICLGEARHAGRIAEWRWENIPDGESRSESYKFAVEFDPIKALPKLEELFSSDTNDWRGPGYGVSSWAKIARAAMNYGERPDAVFVDNVIDIAHNGGIAFDKYQVSKYMDLYLDFYAELEDFLTEKSNVPNILTDLPPVAWGYSTNYLGPHFGMAKLSERGCISARAKLFIQRYHVTRKMDLPNWLKGVVTRDEVKDKITGHGFSTYKPIEWGTLEPEGKVMNEKKQAKEEYKEAQGKPAEREYRVYKYLVEQLPVVRLSQGKPAYLLALR